MPFENAPVTDVRVDGVTIRCSDLATSAKFYEELLGFVRVWAAGTMIGLTAPATVKNERGGTTDGCRIDVLLDQVEAGQSPVDGSRGVVIGLNVADVDAVHTRIRGLCSGERFGPTNELGVRTASVLDPDGHELWITGPSE